MASFLFYQLEYKILFDVDCVDRAELLTAEAADAYRSVDLRSLFHLAVNLHFLHLDRLGRADIGASAASDTLFRIISNDSIKALGFGVVTPQTAKGTSLQEDGGTDAGSIVDRHSLYIEYFPHINRNLYDL